MTHQRRACAKIRYLYHISALLILARRGCSRPSDRGVDEGKQAQNPDWTKERQCAAVAEI